MKISPFTLAVSDGALDDLQRRLAQTRWFDTARDTGWREGAALDDMRALVAYWYAGFDWRACEAQLNRLPHFVAETDGRILHFIHQRGAGPAPMPLVLTHGWPGSFVEMQALIPLLADPARHGGDARDAFHVVVPSLPGFGFSSIPTRSGTGAYESAGLWADLMDALGYPRFGAQGGDIGAGVSSWLGYRMPERLTGIHLNFIPGSYRPGLGGDQPPISDEEARFLDASAAWFSEHGGYAHVQGTTPQSLALGLNDSPAGLAAWIAEKFHAWSDCDGDLGTAIPRDDLLSNIALYWFTGTIGASFRMYVEGRKRPLQLQPGQRIEVPMGMAHFPKELPIPPRSWVERGYRVQRWTTLPRGGHFAAMEQPELLAEDIRAFFRPLR